MGADFSPGTSEVPEMGRDASETDSWSESDSRAAPRETPEAMNVAAPGCTSDGILAESAECLGAVPLAEKCGGTMGGEQERGGKHCGVRDLWEGR